MALSRRKKKPVVPAGSRRTAPGEGAGAPNEHQDSLWTSAKPTSWQARGTHPSPQTCAQRLAKGPRLCPRVHLPSRANKLHLAAGNSFRPRLVDVRGCLSWVGRPVSAKWVVKPTAMDSDPSEPAVSSEAVNRLMSSDMSGPLSDMPVGTTTHAQVTNACLPAGDRSNKTPIFISGVRDAHAFLACLRGSCPGGLTAQLKAEKLMVVPSTANGFRAVVSALQSLDGGGRL